MSAFLRHLTYMFAVSMAVAALLIVIVFATGNTFGQRCAKDFPDKGDLWLQCVQRLKSG